MKKNMLTMVFPPALGGIQPASEVRFFVGSEEIPHIGKADVTLRFDGALVANIEVAVDCVNIQDLPEADTIAEALSAYRDHLDKTFIPGESVRFKGDRK